METLFIMWKYFQIGCYDNQSAIKFHSKYSFHVFFWSKFYDCGMFTVYVLLLVLGCRLVYQPVFTVVMWTPIRERTFSFNQVRLLFYFSKFCASFVQWLCFKVFIVLKVSLSNFNKYCVSYNSEVSRTLKKMGLQKLI